MTKPNILFFLIDGLRADTFYGNNKTSKTLNIDTLVKKGAYFTQAIATADGTFLSLNSIFNSLFPFVTGVRTRKLVFTQNNYLTKLNNFGYHIYGLVPKLTSLKPVIEFFENDDNVYEAEPPNVVHLHEGLGNQIINTLDSQMKQPWFYYIHLNDLHWPYKIPTEYDEEIYGKNPYEKIISSIDFWIGKIIEKINFEKTLVTITSDHGALIPVDNKGITDFEPDHKLLQKTGKQIIPKSLYPVSSKLYRISKKTIRNIKLASANRNLQPYQKRSRLPYFTLSLFDESIHIPLLFVGKSINPKLISHQVCSVDIFPTISELINMSSNTNQHGRSLVPYLEGKNMEERPIYLHTIPYEKISPDDKVGIRTSRYKYFRSSHNKNENINLYNLKNDPYENINISKSNIRVINKMEEILVDYTKDLQLEHEGVNTEEEEKIRLELKKLGYL